MTIRLYPNLPKKPRNNITVSCSIGTESNCIYVDIRYRYRYLIVAIDIKKGSQENTNLKSFEKKREAGGEVQFSFKIRIQVRKSNDSDLPSSEPRRLCESIEPIKTRESASKSFRPKIACCVGCWFCQRQTFK